MQMRNRGFSLIELIIVVTIIAILAAMTLPTYSLNTTKTKISTVIPLLDKLMHDLLVSYSSRGMPPSSFNGVSGAGSGSYAPFVNEDLTNFLYYVNGNGWANTGAMIALSIPPDVGRGIPGYIESTNGSDGMYNSIAIAFYDNGGAVALYCGRWDSTSTLYVPPDFLPPGCDSDNFIENVTGL